VALVSRIDNIGVIFYQRALRKRRYSAKETYKFKEATNRSHPIAGIWEFVVLQYQCMYIWKGRIFNCHASCRHRVSVYEFYYQRSESLVFSSMGWLRWVGSIKLLVSFAKEPYKREYILQKRPIISRSLLIVAPPCQCMFIWKGGQSNRHVSCKHKISVYES